MKKKKNVVKNSSKEYIHSVKKETTAAILTAFAFLIALAWRDAISEFINYITSHMKIQGSLVTALFVTLISVVGILVIKKYFSE